MTRIRFASWAQTAVGGAIDAVDGPGALPAADLTPGLSLVRPDRTSTPLRAPAAVRMIGPEAVAGLDPRAVVRTDPPAGAGEVEDNYLACVDLRPVELPWLFTPARPDARNRLRPWIVLVVVEVARSRLTTDGPVPVLHVGTDQLPDLDDSWGWAHVQHAADPGQSVARLLCPRRLAPTTRYLACVVPAFAFAAATATYEPAWRIGAGDAHLPVYYSWEFGTGVTGDFEHLVRRLGPAPDDRIAGLGRMLVDVRKPWTEDAPLAGAPDPAPLAVAGALVAIGADPAEPLPPTVLPDFVSRLAAQCNAAEGLHDAGTATPFAVAPPIYGGRHVNRTAIPTNTAQVDDWLDDLNVHIPTRVAAGLGAEYVRANQETLMARAWEQVGAIREANRRRAMGQLATVVGEAMHRKHVRNLRLGETVAVAAPAATRTRPWSDGPPLATAVAVSVAPNAVATSAFARFVRSSGPVARATGTTSSSVVTRALAGDVAVPAPRSAPSFATRPEEPAPEPAATATGATAALAERSVTAATDLILLRALADTARVSGLADTAQLVTAQLAALPVDMTAVRAGRITELRQSVAPQLATVTDAIAATRGRLAGPMGLRLDPGTLRTRLVAALSPGDRIARRVAAEVTVPPSFSTARGGSELDTVMKCPEFPAPMALGLLQSAPHWFLPGLAEFPAESVTLLAVNGPFVESFLVGLSHELNRELLWREFPTDMRGTSFRAFWPRPDGAPDIPPVHTWTGPLGSHLTLSTAGIAVLLVRGTVVRRFPDMLVAAAPAVSAVPGQQPVVDQDPAHWVPPMFLIPVDEQTIAYAFPLDPDVLASPPRPGSPGFFFAFGENSSRIRFGFDLENATFGSWNDLDWPRVLAGSPRPFARAGVGVGTPTNPADMQWDRDATDIARIALQRPFRMLIHSSELVGNA